jgi:hypothetical protein
LACRKAKEFGYPHELWTTRLLASHVREYGPAEGHACLANLAQGTVCKILAQEEVKPHKVRYYLERRDPNFAEKMADVLSVYREVKVRRGAEMNGIDTPGEAVVVSARTQRWWKRRVKRPHSPTRQNLTFGMGGLRYCAASITGTRVRR